MTLPQKLIIPVFLLIVFTGAMILGPLLYFALEPFHVPFHRAMDRALMLSAIASLILFRLRIPLRELWPLGHVAWLQVAFGYTLALVSAQTMIALDFAFCGFTSSGLTNGQLGERLVTAVVAAFFVPLLEETVFRGFLLRELAGSLGRRWGCAVAALIFMLAHFLKVPESLDHSAVHLWSGVSALGSAFLPLAHGDFLSGRGVNLFLIGLILGGIFLCSGTLWINAALHSGWILVLLLFSGLTRPEPPPSILFGPGDLLSSPITSLVLVLLAFWLWHFYPPPSAEPESGGEPGANAPSD